MKIAFVVLSLVVCTLGLPTGEEGDKFEGDIILTPEQMMAVEEQHSKNGNQFAAIKKDLWKTNGKTDVIKYYIESSLTSQQKAMDAISAAITDYHKYTCIRFKREFIKPRGPHLSIYSGGGCSSHVGRLRSTRGQRISLSKGCWSKGTAMHEIGHALGFFHEQSRPDRDNYVQIMTSNINSGTLRNFIKQKTDRIDSLGSKYDFESMMHYGKGYFAKSSGLVTIRTKDPKMQNVIGQRNGFSTGDIDQLNKMYCNGVIPSTLLPPTLTPATLPPSTNSPGCSNISSTPFCTKNIKHCTNSSFRKNCRKTCGDCHNGCSNISTTPFCTINIKHCTNSSFRKKCRKTCGDCV